MKSDPPGHKGCERVGHLQRAVPERCRAARPTLLKLGAGQASEGVRIWFESRRLIARDIAVMLALLALAAFGWFIPPVHWMSVWGAALSVTGLALATRSWLRPCFIAVDDEGITASTLSRYRIWPWSEIVSASQKEKGLILRLRTGGEVAISTSTHPRSDRERLVSEVVSRAGLQPAPNAPGLYTRSESAPALSRPG